MLHESDFWTFVSNQREIPQPVGYIKIEKFQPFGIWKLENVNVINHSFNSAKLLLEPKIMEKIVKIELLKRIFYDYRITTDDPIWPQMALKLREF